MLLFGDTEIDGEGRELLEHGTKKFPVGCYFDDLRRKSVPYHWHEEFEIGIICEGEVLVKTPSLQKKLKKGECFFINSGVLHTYENGSLNPVMGETGACSVDELVFHADFIGGSKESVFWETILSPLIERSGITLLSFVDTEEAMMFQGDIWEKDSFLRILNGAGEARLMKEAWIECVTGEEGFEINVRFLLTKLLSLLLKEPPECEVKPDKENQVRNERVKLMLTYIHEHYGEPVTVRDIADSASVSISECLRCFRSVLESSPMVYLKRYRLQRAAALLETTDWKISYIAQQCGFNEMSYFARTFKEAYGATPSAYRKNFG